MLAFASLITALFVLTSILLLNGAILHGSGTQKYPLVQGKYLKFQPEPEGPELKVFYRCQGTCSGSNLEYLPSYLAILGAQTSLPTIIFESDGSHGVGDWQGLLNAMDMRHRICVWDKLGLGFSSYSLSMYKYSEQGYYSSLIQALINAEPNFQPPYIFAG